MNTGGRAHDEKERRCDKEDENRTEKIKRHIFVASVRRSQFLHFKLIYCCLSFPEMIVLNQRRYTQQCTRRH